MKIFKVKSMTGKYYAQTLLTCSALLWFLTGCVVGPDYISPEAKQDLATWEQSMEAGLKTAQEVIDAEVEKLTEIKGIGEKLATNIIEGCSLAIDEAAEEDDDDDDDDNDDNDGEE